MTNRIWRLYYEITKYTQYLTNMGELWISILEKNIVFDKVDLRSKLFPFITGESASSYDAAHINRQSTGMWLQFLVAEAMADLSEVSGYKLWSSPLCIRTTTSSCSGGFSWILIYSITENTVKSLI